MRHDNSNEQHTEQPEQFDEVTGGYSEREHDRAARRIMADIRAMEATPRRGSWKASTTICEPCAGHRVMHVHDTRTKDIVCQFWMPSSGSEEELVASVKLGAAAPDLLEALQTLANAIEFRIDDPRAKMLDAARAAIARATR